MLDSGVRALNKTVDRTESRDGVGGGGSNCSGQKRRGQRQDLPPHCVARRKEEATVNFSFYSGRSKLGSLAELMAISSRNLRTDLV